MRRLGFWLADPSSVRRMPSAIFAVVDLPDPFGPISVTISPASMVIDTPRTRPILGAGKPDEFFAKATAIAEEMFRVAHQDKSTWSFTVELRPFGEVW